MGLEIAIGGGGARTVEVVDLTVPLTERTPVIQLPPPLANTKGLTLEQISRYDKQGPAWYWNNISIGEHAGTHFDAPAHWITGRDKATVDRVPLTHLVAPAAVVDMSAEVARDPDFLLQVEHLDDVYAPFHQEQPVRRQQVIGRRSGDMVEGDGVGAHRSR